MRRFGSELIFISRIKRDGSGIEFFGDEIPTDIMRAASFKLMPLSITLKTYIASEFNSYVVALKNHPPNWLNSDTNVQVSDTTESE